MDQTLHEISVPCSLAAQEPGCGIRNFSDALSPIRTFVRVRKTAVHTLDTWHHLGANLTDICKFLVFFLAFLAGDAWRAVFPFRRYFISTIYIVFACGAKPIFLFVVFKIM